MSKHTPGPWRIDEYGTVRAGGRALLLTGVALTTGNHSAHRAAAANTKLIAAAPEMLELLKLLYVSGRLGKWLPDLEKETIYKLVNKIEGNND